MRTFLAAAAVTAAILAAPTVGAHPASVAVVVGTPGFGVRLGPMRPAFTRPPAYVPAPAYIPPPVYLPQRVVYVPSLAAIRRPVIYRLPFAYVEVPLRRHWRNAHLRPYRAIVPIVSYDQGRY